MLYYLVVTQILPLNQHMLWLYFVWQSFLLYNVSTNVTLKSNIIPIIKDVFILQIDHDQNIISPPHFFFFKSLKMDLWPFTTNLFNVVTSTIQYTAFNIFIRFSFKNLTILASSFYNCYVFTWLIDLVWFMVFNITFNNITVIYILCLWPC